MFNEIVAELSTTGSINKTKETNAYYKNLARLHDYFHEDELEWRVARTGIVKDRPYAQLLIYVTSRAIMNRLDEVFGPTNWKNQITYGPSGQVIQTISVWDAQKQEWISKSDGAEETDIEAVKGGISGALKRAGVLFGIGRYLYEFGNSYGINIEKRKPGAIRCSVKDNGQKIDFWVMPPAIEERFLPGNEPWKTKG